METVKVKLEDFMPLLMFRLGFEHVKSVVGITEGSITSVGLEIDDSFHISHYDMEWLQSMSMSLDVIHMANYNYASVNFEGGYTVNRQKKEMNIPFNIYEEIVKGFVGRAFHLCVGNINAEKADEKSNEVACFEIKKFDFSNFEFDKRTLVFLTKHGYTLRSWDNRGRLVFIIRKEL